MPAAGGLADPLNDGPNNSPKRKRAKRGPYKQYLEPNKQLLIPISTIRSREKRRRLHEADVLTNTRRG